MPPVTFDSNTVMGAWVPFRVDSRPEVGSVIYLSDRLVAHSFLQECFQNNYEQI